MAENNDAYESFDELRSDKNRWNLASDLRLLNTLKSSTDEIARKIQNQSTIFDDLNYKTNICCSKIDNIITDVLILTNSKFIENRVYEEDIKEISIPKIDAAESNRRNFASTSEQAAIGRLKKSINFGINLLAEKCDISAADFAPNIPFDQNTFLGTLYVYKNRFANKPLPFLIGSEDFIRDTFVGLKIENESNPVIVLDKAKIGDDDDDDDQDLHMNESKEDDEEANFDFSSQSFSVHKASDLNDDIFAADKIETPNQEETSSPSAVAAASSWKQNAIAVAAARNPNSSNLFASNFDDDDDDDDIFTSKISSQRKTSPNNYDDDNDDHNQSAKHDNDNSENINNTNNTNHKQKEAQNDNKEITGKITLPVIKQKVYESNIFSSDGDDSGGDDDDDLFNRRPNTLDNRISKSKLASAAAKSNNIFAANILPSNDVSSATSSVSSNSAKIFATASTANPQSRLHSIFSSDDDDEDIFNVSIKPKPMDKKLTTNTIEVSVPPKQESAKKSNQISMFSSSDDDDDDGDLFSGVTKNNNNNNKRNTKNEPSEIRSETLTQSTKLFEKKSSASSSPSSSSTSTSSAAAAANNRIVESKQSAKLLPETSTKTVSARAPFTSNVINELNATLRSKNMLAPIDADEEEDDDNDNDNDNFDNFDSSFPSTGEAILALPPKQIIQPPQIVPSASVLSPSSLPSSSSSSSSFPPPSTSAISTPEIITHTSAIDTISRSPIDPNSDSLNDILKHKAKLNSGRKRKPPSRHSITISKASIDPLLFENANIAENTIKSSSSSPPPQQQLQPKVETLARVDDDDNDEDHPQPVIEANHRIEESNMPISQSLSSSSPPLSLSSSTTTTAKPTQSQNRLSSSDDSDSDLFASDSLQRKITPIPAAIVTPAITPTVTPAMAPAMAPSIVPKDDNKRPTKKISLFDSSDDDDDGVDDIFAETSKVTKSILSQKSAQKSTATKTTNNTSSTIAAFDDDEDDFFFTPNVIKDAKSHATIKSGINETKSSKPPSQQQQQQQQLPKKNKSIFDDDSDDDLFK